MSAKKSHTDPFNAAEPVLPWEEAQSAHGACEFGADMPYEAPSKQRDRYRAPKARSAKTPSVSPQSPQTPQAPQVSQGPQAPQAPQGLQASQGEGRAPSQKSAPAPSIDIRRVARAPRATVVGVIGKGCGGCALVVFLFSLAMALLGVVVGLLEEPLGGEDNAAYEVTTDIDDEAGEADIAAQAESRLAAFADDAWLKTAISTSFSQDCEELLGYTTDELGLDVQAYVDWLLSGYSFAQEGAYCFDGYNGEEPSGSAYFSIAGYDASTFCSDFRRAVYAYLEEQGISLGSHPALSEEQKAAIGALFDEQCAQTPVDSDYYYLRCEFTYSEGAWHLDEEDFNEQIESVFGVYGLL